MGWGDAFVDLDNSGWQDLILVNGHVYPQVDSVKIGSTYREPKLVYQNQRNGTFREVGALTGTAAKVPQVSRGLAVGDLFNRGRLDIVIENLTGGPMILEAKSNPANHWVSFELEGSATNKLALNARVLVTTGKMKQMAEVRSGGSYLSQSDLRLHFGLGEAARIDKVEVQWPNGKTQVFEGRDRRPLLSLETGRKLDDNRLHEARGFYPLIEAPHGNFEPISDWQSTEWPQKMNQDERPLAGIRFVPRPESFRVFCDDRKN